MRLGLITLLLSAVLLTGFQCCKEPLQRTSCLKGRLEVKGICMNYTIKVLDGAIDSDLIQDTWTDPSTNKTHQNVFGLASVCDFPSDIAEGEEFYFTINSSPNTSCFVCEAYYPTPQKKLHISVSKAPCNQ